MDLNKNVFYINKKKSKNIFSVKAQTRSDIWRSEETLLWLVFSLCHASGHCGGFMIL